MTGDPAAHLAVILKEALGQKTGKNRLGEHRPNLVAVNYLLSTDAQVAMHLRDLPRSIELPDSIDGLAVARGLGINEQMDRSRLWLVKAREPWDPVLDIVADPI